MVIVRFYSSHFTGEHALSFLCTLIVSRGIRLLSKYVRIYFKDCPRGSFDLYSHTGASCSLSFSGFSSCSCCRLRLALAPDFAPAPVLLMQLLLQDKLTAPTPKPFLCDLYQTLNSLQDLKPWSYTELGTLPETFDFRSGLL